MIREFTCIICPNGCEMEACIEDDKLLSLKGALCKRGNAYVEQELTDPQRNIASSVLVEDGEIPLVSVRLSKAIPKDRIFDVMQQIKEIKITAPVMVGQVLVENVLGLQSDIIATKRVKRI